MYYIVDSQILRHDMGQKPMEGQQMRQKKLCIVLQMYFQTRFSIPAYCNGLGTEDYCCRTKTFEVGGPRIYQSENCHLQ